MSPPRCPPACAGCRWPTWCLCSSLLRPAPPSLAGALPFWPRAVMHASNFLRWTFRVRPRDTHRWSLPYYALGSTVVACKRCGYFKFESASLRGLEADCDTMVVQRTLTE